MKQKVRDLPRVSLNVLSEYLVASPNRRRRLIEEQKKPRTFRVVYYSEAEESIAAHLVTGDLAELQKGLEKTKIQEGDTDWEITRKLTCADAIRSFMNLKLEFSEDYKAERGLDRAQLSVGSVSVSVRPEVLLSHGASSSGKLGGIKLYISKSEPMAAERARFAGAVLLRYLTELQRGVVDYRNCFVVDVFAGKVFVAPRTLKRRWQDIEAACREIALHWDSV
ncbi:MAG: hypothetical protein BWY92_01644 [Firmicutes bacterium ADurb.BinA052]|nr:MAG: hypothetical protein BWY92_01644 [Firmicutes bacterium ADurb.BinA052]